MGSFPKGTGLHKLALMSTHGVPTPTFNRVGYLNGYLHYNLAIELEEVSGISIMLGKKTYIIC